MDKRMLLAIILSIAILITYQYLMPTAPPPAPVKDAKEAVTEKDKNPKAVPQSIAPSLIPKPETSGVEEEIKVENDLYIAVLTSKGGAMKSIELKKFKDKSGGSIILKGDDVLSPLSMGMDEEFQFSNVNFSAKGKNIKLDAASKTADIIFEYSAGGRSIRRTYTFHSSDYGIDLKDETGGLTSYWITLGKNFGIYEKDDSTHFGPVILKDADRMEFTVKDLKETKNFREGIKWIAQEDKYFFSSIVPKTKIEDSKVWSKNDNTLAALKMPGGVNEYYVYIGPKEYDNLKKLGMGLEHIVDFGFFSIIAMPLFWVLKLFYRISNNYGVAIIILTTVVRIPFIPLINKSQQSMKKLQDIQPRMAEVKEKYKNDPQKMQKETMELYKKHKVNPLGGCLPMVLQIPVFFALYKVLLIAIELRDAPFMFWIHDLSVKDPYYVLPVIMGATMVIQQKMTPSTMDPMQQKIMMLMPVVFTFMFLSFPSGLVVYWLVNNVLSIAQQFYVNSKLKKQPA
ncbi:MAG TPA: hypothetical protein DHW81_01655 [Nitrospiraceae bacterium]|nr:hypothetical protein [Nitrospiraceae bacterium]